ncbi:MAG: fatty acid desaturase [Bacteroidetes bacterium]|nr:fatty acid desaturase [Bacteroidota bacterium]
MLRYTADRRTLFVVALYFVVAALPWFLWPQMGRGQIVFWVVLNCIVSFMCAVIVHNTIHAPIFKKRWMNKVMQIVLSFTYGHSTSAYVPGHNFSHHKYTQSDKDSIRTSKARFKINLFNQLFFFFLMSGDILKGELRFASVMRKERPDWFRQYLLEMALVIGVKVVLLFVNWKCAVLFVLIPHQYAAWGIVGTNYFQHDGCDQEHPYNHSRNFKGKLLNYLLFNNGYHGAHHMKPNLHWSLVPAYHHEHLEPNIHPSLNRESLLAYLIEAHIYPAKRLDYLGQPVVLAAATADVDWVKDVNVGAHKEDMAA